MSPVPGHGGQSMCGRLRRVLVCSPEAAGWGDPERAGRWNSLGYHIQTENKDNFLSLDFGSIKCASLSLRELNGAGAFKNLV